MKIIWVIAVCFLLSGCGEYKCPKCGRVFTDSSIIVSTPTLHVGFCG